MIKKTLGLQEYIQSLGILLIIDISLLISNSVTYQEVSWLLDILLIYRNSLQD